MSERRIRQTGPWNIASLPAERDEPCGCKPYSPCDRHDRREAATPSVEVDANALATALYRGYDYTVTPDDIRDALARLSPPTDTGAER